MGSHTEGTPRVPGMRGAPDFEAAAGYTSLGAVEVEPVGGRDAAVALPLQDPGAYFSESRVAPCENRETYRVDRVKRLAAAMGPTEYIDKEGVVRHTIDRSEHLHSVLLALGDSFSARLLRPGAA